MHSTELRVLTPDEWEIWRGIRLEALAAAPYAFASKLADWETASPDRWRARLARDGSLHVVAFAGERAVGMVSGMPDDEPDRAWLLSMFVTAEARGRGVGGLLVDAVERWAADRGAERLCLEVVAENHAARWLYEGRGWVVTGEVPRESPEEPLELYMAKRLRP